MTTPSVVAARKSLEPWILDSVQYYPHQIEGCRKLFKRKSFLLADDMGLGKSLQALTIFAMDVIKGWSNTGIVVCPVTLKSNWQDEIAKFTRFKCVVLEGTVTQRQAQILEFMLIEGPKLLIVNYEQVKAHLDQLNAFNFDVAIFDEAHYLKNPKSERTKACHKLYSRRSFLLTGTPMLNHVNELWSLLHRIDPEMFPKYWSFVSRYCVFGGFKDKQIVGVKNEKFLIEVLDDYMVRRLKSEVLDLPEIQVIERRVDLAPEQRKLYDNLVKEMVLPNPATGTDDEIENALTKFLRLKQICGTTEPFTDQDISSKLDLAVEDLQGLIDNGHKVVVFSQFRAVQECFLNRINGFDQPYLINGSVPMASRVPTVKAWAESPVSKTIICGLQVAGVGLNMVAARHVFFLDKLFVPGLNRQAIDRLHRIGQDKTQPVQVWEYIARNTIENRINAILRVKTQLNMQIVENDPDWKRKLLAAIEEDDA